ncbi:nonstructural protein [Peromfec virus RodF8_61]|uniref:Nonstructural protein n=1 Tax=Peromfec virus RodF8_61 TaxID=2929387 RepID=A0A976N1M3_9VIRU|nr:nonstructural protein [Peromfec virus RodF8_61]
MTKKKKTLILRPYLILKGVVFLLYYAVFDDAVKCYMNPFPARSDGEALREFGFAVNNVNTSINAHPHDFHLYKVGEFDDRKGTFVPLDSPPVFLSHAADWQKVGEDS